MIKEVDETKPLGVIIDKNLSSLNTLICCVKSFFCYRGSHKRIATETAIQIYNAII